MNVQSETSRIVARYSVNRLRFTVREDVTVYDDGEAERFYVIIAPDGDPIAEEEVFTTEPDRATVQMLAGEFLREYRHIRAPVSDDDFEPGEPSLYGYS